jgi:hypothetical protein
VNEFARGDFVRLACKGETVSAFVAYVSPAGSSMIVMFAGVFCGYSGSSILFREPDAWHNVRGEPVEVVSTDARKP